MGVSQNRHRSGLRDRVDTAELYIDLQTDVGEVLRICSAAFHALQALCCYATLQRISEYTIIEIDVADKQ